MADGNNIETLSIGLTLDISQLDANTQKALKNISQLSGGVGNLNNEMGGMRENADKGGNAMSAMTVKIAAAIKIIETIIKVIQKMTGAVKSLTDAAEAEHIALTKLNTILGNTYKVNSDYTESLFRYIKGMEQAGAVSSDALVQATQTLSAYTTSLQQVEDLIPAVADLAASLYGTGATAQNAQTLATAIGRALNGSTEALARYGVQLSDTTKEILKDETISRAEKVNAIIGDIESRVGGMNEALGKTFSGQINQIKAAIQDIKQNLGYIIENFVTPFLPIIKQWVLRLKEISAIWVEISKILTGMDSTKLPEVGAGLAEGLEDANEEADQLSGKLLGFDKFNALDDSAEGEKEEVDTSMVTALMTTFNDMSGIVEEAKKIIAELDIPGILAGIKEALLPLWNLVKGIFDALGKAFKTIGENLSGVFEKLHPIFESIQVVVDGVLEVLSPILQTILHIVGAIIEVVAALFKSENASGNFKDSVMDLAEAIKGILDIIITIVDYLKPIFITINSFIGQVITSLARLISRVLLVIVNVVKKILDALQPIIDIIFDLLNSGLETVLEVIGTILEVIFDLVGEIFDVVEPALTPILSLIKGIANLLQKILKPAIDQAKNWLSGFVDFVKNIFGTFSNIFKDFVAIFKALMEGDFSGVFRAIGNLFVDILNGICNGFKTFMDWIVNALNASITWLNNIIEFFGGDPLRIPSTDEWGWKKDPIPRFAMGGLPDKGSLFIANEAGPELVGNIGGASAVANNKMIEDAIEAAAYRGFSRALAGAGGGSSGQALTLTIDGNNVNDSALVRALMPAMKTEVKRRGGDSSVFGK